MKRNRIDPEHSIRFAREWFCARNNHDLERILEHYDDSLEFTSPFAARILNDSEGIIRGKVRSGTIFPKGLPIIPTCGSNHSIPLPG